MISIKLTSVMVNDQDKALAFYTEVLGFQKQLDIPMGEYRWLTVVSPAEPEGTQLVLEPNNNPAAQTFQSALFAQGIPFTAFAVDDLQAEYARLKALGVTFQGAPSQGSGPAVAVLDDTCGNFIQIFQA